MRSSSPVNALKGLDSGWDGYWAASLSDTVVERAEELWQALDRNCSLPKVSPAANGAIDFSWSADYPRKELCIWLYDQPEYYAEVMISNSFEDTEFEVFNPAVLLEAIATYHKLNWINPSELPTI